jgi:heme o synthase
MAIVANRKRTQQQSITAGAARRATWQDYANLTKPRVISLLLLTTVTAMLIAGDGVPPASVILLTLLGGYLAAGGAGVLNCYLDGDIDALMSRTRRRPIPDGRIAPHKALLFGLILSLLSFIILWWGANLLAAVLATLGILYYVVIYTMVLKRRTTQNIVIGGAAGAIPPLVGWAAVTGSLDLTAAWLFLIIFFWTPPHFWALALVRRAEYAKAGVPMLPVVRGPAATRLQIVVYSVILMGLSLLPVLWGPLGALYAAVAVTSGSWFVFSAVQLWRRPGSQATWRLYRYSLLYLALLFVAMVIDRL